MQIKEYINKNLPSSINFNVLSTVYKENDSELTEEIKAYLKETPGNTNWNVLKNFAKEKSVDKILIYEGGLTTTILYSSMANTVSTALIPGIQLIPTSAKYIYLSFTQTTCECISDGFNYGIATVGFINTFPDILTVVVNGITYEIPKLISQWGGHATYYGAVPPAGPGDLDFTEFPFSIYYYSSDRVLFAAPPGIYNIDFLGLESNYVLSKSLIPMHDTIYYGTDERDDEGYPIYNSNYPYGVAVASNFNIEINENSGDIFFSNDATTYPYIKIEV